MTTPRKWFLRQRQTIFRNGFLHLQREECQHPDLGEHSFFVLGFRDWVNITPVTEDGQLVLVRQYRRGTDDITLEIPSGSMDPGETDALSAAIRELREETGYIASEIIPVARVAVNPAIQDNHCHLFLATGCTYDGPPSPDGTEELETVLIPLTEVPELLEKGEIVHSLGMLGMIMSLQRLRTQA